MEPYGQYRLIREMESLLKKFKQQANLDGIPLEFINSFVVWTIPNILEV